MCQGLKAFLVLAQLGFAAAQERTSGYRGRDRSTESRTTTCSDRAGLWTPLAWGQGPCSSSLLFCYFLRESSCLEAHGKERRWKVAENKPMLAVRQTHGGKLCSGESLVKKSTAISCSRPRFGDMWALGERKEGPTKYTELGEKWFTVGYQV